MALWWKLPRELQKMIYDQLYLDPERRPEHHVVAKCASVCRDWQTDFEFLNFDRLVLSQSCLPAFRDAVRGRKRHRLRDISRIWLRIRLDEYDCSVCQTAEDEETMRKFVFTSLYLRSCSSLELKLTRLSRNCITFTNAVWSLLKILSTSVETQQIDHEGMELEISAHSPSDCQHVFRPFCLQDDYPYLDASMFCNKFLNQRGNYEALRHRHAAEASYHDPPHGWNHGSHVVPNPTGSRARNPSGRDRLFGTRLLRFDFSRIPGREKGFSHRKQRLPRARIVKHFTVRRACYRGFSANVLFKLLHESFTQIESARIERWLELYPSEQTSYSEEFYRLLCGKGLPKTLKNLSLLQDEDSATHRCAATEGLHDHMLGFQMARASQHLTNLSITYQADAWGFFHKFLVEDRIGASSDLHIPPMWENLQTLSLTCASLVPYPSPEQEEQQVADLLRAACSAAKQMPRLEHLQIWQCGRGSAALFTFKLRRDPMDEESESRIAWDSSWPASFGPQSELFSCWRELARKRHTTRREPQVVVYTISPTMDQLETRWGISRHLRLKQHMLHALSRHQIIGEALQRDQSRGAA